MSGDQADKKKVTPFNVLSSVALVVVVQAVALWITNENKPVYSAVGPISVGPLPNTSAGSAGNAFFLVLLVFLATLGLVVLLRRKLVRTFKTVVFVSVSFSAFTLTWLTIDGVFLNYSWYGTFPYTQDFELLLAFLPVIAIGYTIFVKNYTPLSTIALCFISAEVGSFFASTLPLTTALLLPLIFALYDIYAVFKGPLKQLVSMAPSGALAGMSIKAGEFTVGLGDIVFYSMLPSIGLFYLQPAPALVTLVAVDGGVALTLYLLTKKRLLPGLPIPMLLGVLVLAAYFL